MENESYKNKIIAISGEPVSGKGTAVKILIEKLKEKGFKEENIHLKTSGQEFRKYINSIIELILNLDDEQKAKELSERIELINFFSKKDSRKILSETIIDLKNKNINLSNFTIGQANEAKEFKKIRNIIDSLIDDEMKRYGEKINKKEHPDEVWIMDSRLAFYNIPEAFSIRLTSNSKVAGERLFNDNKRGNEDHYKTIEEAIEEREKRKISENNRYMEKYNIDLKDENNYDLIIDTSYSKPEDITDTIIQCLELYYKNKDFAKKWASPKIFLPMQNERLTMGGTLITSDLSEMIDSINKNGYYADSPIEIYEVDGKKFILEGHHRNFALGYLGKTLIPYEEIAKDDELIQGSKTSAKDMAKGLNLSDLYGHEDLLMHGYGTFSYEDIYPELIDDLINKKESQER